MRSLTLMSARLVFALAVSSFLYSLSYALTVFTLDPEEESGILPLSYSYSYSYSSLPPSPSPSLPLSLPHTSTSLLLFLLRLFLLFFFFLFPIPPSSSERGCRVLLLPGHVQQFFRAGRFLLDLSYLLQLIFWCALFPLQLHEALSMLVNIVVGIQPVFIMVFVK